MPESKVEIVRRAFEVFGEGLERGNPTLSFDEVFAELVARAEAADEAEQATSERRTESGAAA